MYTEACTGFNKFFGKIKRKRGEKTLLYLKQGCLKTACPFSELSRNICPAVSHGLGNIPLFDLLCCVQHCTRLCLYTKLARLPNFLKKICLANICFVFVCNFFWSRLFLYKILIFKTLNNFFLHIIKTISLRFLYFLYV